MNSHISTAPSQLDTKISGGPAIWLKRESMIAPLVFFRSITARKPLYTLPLLPPAGLPVSVWFEQHEGRVVGEGTRVSTQGVPRYRSDDNPLQSHRYRTAFLDITNRYI